MRDKRCGWCLGTILIINIILIFTMTACGNAKTLRTESNSGKSSKSSIGSTADNKIYGEMKGESGDAAGLTSEDEAESLSAGLTYTGRDENLYAQNFAIDRYEDGSRLLSVANGDRYLVTTKDKGDIADIPEDVTVLKEPVDNIYLVSTASMDYFVKLNELSKLSFASLRSEDWTINEAAEALKNEDIIYAGRYSEPDYELLAMGGCKLAIENTMIYHSPEVLDKLHDLGIATMIEYSSYEEHPLGRLEWIRFYGALTGVDQKAGEIFKRECRLLDDMDTEGIGDKSVAFFYFTQSGTVNVRVSDDYVPKMIELAGGKYAFPDIITEGKKSSIDMTLEEFVSAGSDADVLIYNSTIDGELNGIDELLDKNSTLAGFKAVKNGEVYCTTISLYQRPMGCADLIKEFNTILKGEYKDGEGEFIYKLR